MRILGQFDQGAIPNRAPAPIVSAFVGVPALSAFGVVWFLIDTGADFTSIHPADLVRLRIDSTHLSVTHQMGGIAGQADYHEEPAELVFQNDQGMPVRFSLPILLAKPNPGNLSAPSLLGRDFMQRGALSMDQQANLVAFDFPDHLFGLRGQTP